MTLLDAEVRPPRYPEILDAFFSANTNKSYVCTIFRAPAFADIVGIPPKWRCECH